MANKRPGLFKNLPCNREFPHTGLDFRVSEDREQQTTLYATRGSENFEQVKVGRAASKETDTL
jgi:hypothetical protein